MSDLLLHDSFMTLFFEVDQIATHFSKARRCTNPNGDRPGDSAKPDCLLS